jgi:tRNA pseudouridine38-40 synthase
MVGADDAAEPVRIAMGVEYDGGAYRGWQLQRHAITVQEKVEAAVSRVADEPIRVHCAGRTDAGVHAEGQVIHFDTRASRSRRGWVLGTNSHLPDDIAVRWARQVPDSFHARFSARGRHYRYLILCRQTRSALWRNRAVWTHTHLDLARMRTAASLLVGRHDFTSFRALGCQAKSPVRHVRYLELERHGEFVSLRIGADGFLHHMVRNIAGVLMAIGGGDEDVDWTARLLAARDRTKGGVTAPPGGLYLTGVDYPDEFEFPRIDLPAMANPGVHGSLLRPGLGAVI